MGSFMTSWMSRHCALGVILATPGKVHHCSKFSLFVDNGSDRGSLELQSLRNSFITLSKLIRQLFYLFLNFFRFKESETHDFFSI